MCQVTFLCKIVTEKGPYDPEDDEQADNRPRARRADMVQVRVSGEILGREG